MAMKLYTGTNTKDGREVPLGPKIQIIIPAHDKKAKNVIDLAHIKEAIDDMKDWLSANSVRLNKEGDSIRSVALAHAQVSNDPYNFFVVAAPYKHFFNDRRVIINARILEVEGETDFEEGCLSFPHQETVKTRRFNRIKVEYQVPRADSKTMKTSTEWFEGIPAFIIQHEADHAKGINIFNGK